MKNLSNIQVWWFLSLSVLFKIKAYVYCFRPRHKYDECNGLEEEQPNVTMHHHQKALVPNSVFLINTVYV